MPSSATITAFYTFTANTKARSSQVNTNFSVFRGHMLPIDPNTATSVNNTYDLGSSEWRWRRLHAENIYSPFKLISSAGVTLGGMDTVGFYYTRNIVYGVTCNSNFFSTTPSAGFTGSSVAITTRGNPVEYKFIQANAVQSDGFVLANGTHQFWLMRNALTVAAMQIAITGTHPLHTLYFVDTSAPAGTHTYSVQARGFGATSGSTGGINTGMAMVTEL